MGKRTQRDKVLSWLRKNGTLTVRDAVIELNIMSVPKRIEELRKMGYPGDRPRPAADTAFTD